MYQNLESKPFNKFKLDFNPINASFVSALDF